MLRPIRKDFDFATAPQTFTDGLSAFDLNWDVGIRPVFTANQEGELKMIPGYRSVNRLDKDLPLSIVGARYVPVQHKQCADLVDEVVKGLGARYVNGGLFGSGEKVFMQIEFPNSIQVKNSKDEVKRLLSFITSHDGSFPTVIGGSNMRISCLNSFKFAFKEARNDVRVRHTANAEVRLVEAKDILETIINYQNKVELRINELAALPFTDKMMTEVLRSVFEVDPKVTSLTDLPTRTQNSMNKILDFAQSGLGIDSSKAFNGWTVFNSFSQWSNHEKIVKGEDSNSTARTESLLLGSGMQFNLRAQAAIEEVAGL